MSQETMSLLGQIAVIWIGFLGLSLFTLLVGFAFWTCPPFEDWRRKRRHKKRINQK